MGDIFKGITIFILGAICTIMIMVLNSAPGVGLCQ